METKTLGILAVIVALLAGLLVLALAKPAASPSASSGVMANKAISLKHVPPSVEQEVETSLSILNDNITTSLEILN